MRLIAKAISI